MENTNYTMVAIAAVACLLIGGMIGMQMAPEGETITDTIEVEVAPLNGKTVSQGYVCGTTQLEIAKPWYDEITKDLTTISDRLGYDVDFEYMIDTHEGQAAIHLEKVQAFHSMDVEIIINSGGSSYVAACMSYMNENDMIMWSETSTSPIISIKDDSLFRMIPNDLVQAPAIAQMLTTYGIEAAVFIHVGNAWGDGIYNILTNEYAALGGVELEEIRFAPETQEFSNYLETLEKIVAPAIEEYGAEHVGLHFVCGTPIVMWLSQVKDYPALDSVTWFGSDGEVLLQQMIDDTPDSAIKHKVISTGPQPGSSPKWTALNERYWDLLSLPLGHMHTNGYDIAMILQTSILAAQSYDPVDLMPLQIPTCADHFGASGWTLLDETGDRAGVDYNLWGVKEINGEPEFVVYGIYKFVDDKIIWDTEMLGFTPTSIN